MAAIGIHTVKDVPIHVYASIDDPDYKRTKDVIVVAIDHVTVHHDLYCIDILCELCPFFQGTVSCTPQAIDFLYEHYSSQYPEYFI